MTSKGEAQETSEFLRRRQLRLQQVREQSKDIAKKLRQRAKVEKLRQVVELDEEKARDYKQSQEKFVKKLEELYSRGLDNVGSSHKQARRLTEPANLLEKTDLSHLRGREAAAEVRRQKQQKLDELKKSLDRKVQARAAANVLSRENSASAANRLSTKPSSRKCNVNEATKPTSENVIEDQHLNHKDSPEEISRIDMGTQWDIDLLPPEWEPNIPALAIPPDDDTKQSVADRENSADKQKKTNLFALSDEMPSSLRGSVAQPCDTAPSKLSSTLVSEYIQNRVLRLREPEVTSSKKHSEDLKNLRQTIVRSRPLRPEGSAAFNNICHVVEGQAFPVPSWHPETGCQCQSPRDTHYCKQSPERIQFSNVTHSNKVYSSVCPVKHNLVSSPVSEKTRPFIPHKCCGHDELSGPGNKDGSLRGKGSGNFTKKKSVTMYNHCTRDSRDVPRADERIVHRDRSSEDAYSRALSEAASASNRDKHKGTQDASNKIAVTRQNVEKEYKDTMAFLNCLPKNKNTRSINNAFKDDHRLRAQKENRQRILQQEFKNIEEESRRHDLQGCKLKSRVPDRSPPERSKSPPDLNADNLNERDFRYSWMPVPESDSKLAVHTIPTGARPSVQFRADSYHEYRSRHKHTPPTRDVPRAVVFRDDGSASLDSLASENSSTDGDSAPKRKDDVDDSPQRDLTDTERIIIYKILNHKHRKKNKTCKLDAADDVTQSNEGSKKTDDGNMRASNRGAATKDIEHNVHVAVNNDPLSTENLTEGVYEIAGNKQGNLQSIVNAELDKDQPNNNDEKYHHRKQGPCCHRSDAGDGLQPRKKCSSARCKGHSSKGHSAAETSPGNVEKKADAEAPAAGPQPAAFLKLIDEGEQREGNFYIGATGFLKHDAYEVIIQLRKNDTLKELAKREDVAAEQKSSDTGNENTANTKIEGSQSLEANEDVEQKITDDNNHSVTATAPPTSDPDLGSVIASDAPAANSTEDNKKQCLSNNTSDNVQPTKTMHDRSVSTSVIDTHPLIEPSSKSDRIPRAATSTCTQTTPSPRNPRPVYIHMSSSTSTAYMSPPEVVLPSFFRRGDKSCKKPRRPSRNIDKHEERNFIRPEHHCKRYSSCKIFEKFTEPKVEQLNFHAERYREQKESTLSSPVSYVRNYRCCRCITRGGFDLCCKQHSRKMKHQLNTNKLNMPVRNTKSAIMHSKRNKTNTHSGKLSSKSYLSPMIKDYIHKLLSLNREGIKAIQIINQDCSSVNTPASSIINVPANLGNKNNRHRNLDSHDHDVSLEQLERFLKKHIFLHTDATRLKCSHPESTKKSGNMISNNIKLRKRNSKNKRLHKVKSLNISKKIVVKPSELLISRQARDDTCPRKRLPNNAGSQGTPPPDHIKSCVESGDKGNVLKTLTSSKELHRRNMNQYVDEDSSSGQPKAATSSENNFPSSYDEIPLQAINTSTQTSRTPDGGINFIKLAEDKLQNMEKIADLTEKCTKRLSNLAKVLEEVRKNKSLAYSQVSTPDSTSDSDQKSDKAARSENADFKIPSTVNTKNTQIECNIESTDYEYLVPGVPKPDNVKFPGIDPSENILSENSNTECFSKSFSSVSTNDDCRVNNNPRCRNKPPPALLRIHLKRPQDNVVPHELSTVIEVDSPLSVKFKHQSSSINANQSASHFADLKKDKTGIGEHHLNPELAQNVDDKSSNDKIKVTSSDSSEDTKLQMMDINQFNEIMLRPFVSLQEYARDHYYERSLNTKGESVSKHIGLSEDISSLHSDGSLPDVVAELLKRKLITEPFRFDTASNVNSTTVSSESTLSVLALSKIQKDRSQSKLSANKENVGETSDSLSISSNPDLEHAFKKLGLGWASSTLKKTKERLAWSSSSNTSSSSLSQIKLKNSKQDEAGADPGWSVSSLSKKPALKRRSDVSKNVEQQTSFSNNMTVKEFLTKELAKKITFTDKSNRNDSNQEFVSLFETKLPEDLKNTSKTMLDDNSGDSAPNVNNNRARTSTPVKLFKSMTYHSSSSSNMSNGLFSNADDLSSVKLTSASVRYQSASEKDELTIPNCSLKMRKTLSDCSKTDSC